MPRSTILPLAVAYALALCLLACAPGDGPPAPEEGAAPHLGAVAEQKVGAADDWCRGHALPESMCTKCNPELTEGFKASGDWCAEHSLPESACPSCNPWLPPGSVAQAAEGEVHRPDELPFAPGTVIRFKSPSIEAAVGLKVAQAQALAFASAVEAPAEVDFNEERLAEVRAPVPGILRKMRARPGQRVLKGEVLFELESASVGELQAQEAAAQQQARTAQATLERLVALEEGGVSSQRQLDEAKEALASAEANIAAIEQALAIAGSNGDGGMFTLTAPLSGTVIRREAKLGSWVEPASPLATVADTDPMWVRLAVTPAEAATLAPGMALALTLPNQSDPPIPGSLLWISPEVEAQSRTVKVVAQVDNPEGRLRAHQFGGARVEVEAPLTALAVPRQAIQRLGDANVLFVRSAEGRYEPREVELGRSQGALVQVFGDLEAGAPVVTEGAFLLKTELDRGSIGAGCCEVDGPGGK